MLFLNSMTFLLGYCRLLMQLQKCRNMRQKTWCSWCSSHFFTCKLFSVSEQHVNNVSTRGLLMRKIYASQQYSICSHSSPWQAAWLWWAMMALRCRCWPCGSAGQLLVCCWIGVQGGIHIVKTSRRGGHWTADISMEDNRCTWSVSHTWNNVLRRGLVHLFDQYVINV